MVVPGVNWQKVLALYVSGEEPLRAVDLNLVLRRGEDLRLRQIVWHHFAGKVA